MITLDPSEVEDAPSVPRRHQPRTSPHFVSLGWSLPLSRSAVAPSPKTHSFSPSAWLRANPKGDVKLAIIRARELGYQVVK
jgi:hypothetical protein